MRWLCKAFTLILLALVTVQPIAASQPFTDATATNPELEADRENDKRDRGHTFDAASLLGLQRVRADGAQDSQWEPRGPRSPMLARGLYLTGLAGLGFTAYYTFRNIRDIDSFSTAATVAGLTTVSFASLYLSFRIELGSSGDSSN